MTHPDDAATAPAEPISTGSKSDSDSEAGNNSRARAATRSGAVRESDEEPKRRPRRPINRENGDTERRGNSGNKDGEPPKPRRESRSDSSDSGRDSSRDEDASPREENREQRSDSDRPRRRDSRGGRDNRGRDNRGRGNRNRRDSREREGNRNSSNRDRDRDRDRGDSRNRDGDSDSSRRSDESDEDRRARGRGTRSGPRKPEILGPPEPGEGLLEISGKGFGFLRQKSRNFQQTPSDIFVTPEMVRSLGLRNGMWVEGTIQEGNRGPQLTEIKNVNGLDPTKCRNLPVFEELKAINPNKRIRLETAGTRHTTRIIDILTPIGRGQRGLIVAPPRAGKTTLLHHIAEAVVENYDDIHLMLLLIDERPEEVTELRRALPDVEMMASSNDSDIKSHLRIAQLAIERAKRLVEAGQDVMILLDSITRLGRAFNNASRGGGPSMSGGMQQTALEIPRRLFAAARNTRGAGSLTILGTALIETGSRADELIFQEFKGTGNMELVLDRQIAQQYIYPAVNIFRSGTRREELLLPPHQLEAINTIRRGLAGHKPAEAIERLLSILGRFPSNAQMLLEIPK